MTDPDVSRLRRRELRRIARRHHPDLGGDTETYLAAVARLERWGQRHRPAAVTVRPPPRWASVVRRWRRALRRWRAQRQQDRRRRVDEALRRSARH